MCLPKFKHIKKEVYAFPFTESCTKNEALRYRRKEFTHSVERIVT